MAKQDQPFTDTHWDLMLTGVCKGAKWDPKGGFKPGQKPGTVLWTLLCAHEEMAEGKKSWTQSLSFEDFLRILNGLESLARDTSDGELMKEFKFRFFKDGKMNLSGTSLIIGRAANGVIYMSWRSKKIPKVGFWFRSADSRMLSCNKDGQDEDPRVDSSEFLLAKIQHWRARYQEWSSKAIVEDDYQGNSGGGYSSSNNTSNSTSSSGGSSDDFDDVPF